MLLVVNSRLVCEGAFRSERARNLADHLHAHEVTRSVEMGWQELKNGDLLEAAEDEGFEVLVTADRNLAYQQKLTGRRLAVVVLPSGNWPRLKGAIADVVKAVGKSEAGGFIELKLSRPRRSARARGSSN
jgi:hypothetical protein